MRVPKLMRFCLNPLAIRAIRQARKRRKKKRVWRRRVGKKMAGFRVTEMVDVRRDSKTSVDELSRQGEDVVVEEEGEESELDAVPEVDLTDEPDGGFFESIAEDDDVIVLERDKDDYHLLSDSPLHLYFYPRIILNRKNREELISKNINFKKGKWSAEEDRILMRNWQRYASDYNIDHPDMYLGVFTRLKYVSEAEKRSIQKAYLKAKKLVKSTNMYLRLGKGLDDRILTSVRQRSVRLLTGLRRVGQLTEDEQQEVIYWFYKYGRNWNDIAKKFNCIPDVIPFIISNLLNPKTGKMWKKGRWTDEEDRLLTDAIEKVEKEAIGEREFKWVKIAENMNLTRSWIQCRKRWEETLKWRLANPDVNNCRWKPEDSRKLIHCLYRSDYKNEQQIEWDLLREKFKDITCLNRLMFRWRKLILEVEDHHLKSYVEIINWLWINRVKNKVNEEQINQLDEFCQMDY